MRCATWVGTPLCPMKADVSSNASFGSGSVVAITRARGPTRAQIVSLSTRRPLSLTSSAIVRGVLTARYGSARLRQPAVGPTVQAWPRLNSLSIAPE